MAGELSASAIEAALRGRFGSPLRFFGEHPSTNSEALEWASEGAPEGALVVTDHQTAGRGRMGRSWFSAPGSGLAFSLVLRPRIPVERLGLLTTAAGVACAEGIEGAAALEVRLKWPNDVTSGARKLSGILVETRLGPGGVDVAVVGIGINVDWRGTDPPPKVARVATSIAAELDRAGRFADVDRIAVLAAVIAAFERLYPAVVDERRAPEIVEPARARSDVLGESVTVTLPDGRELTGTATALRRDGSLELEIDGRTSAVRVGEVKRLRPA